MSMDYRLNLLGINPLKLKTVEDCDSLILETDFAIKRLNQMYIEAKEGNQVRVAWRLGEFEDKREVLLARRKGILDKQEALVTKKIEETPRQQREFAKKLAWKMQYITSFYYIAQAHLAPVDFRELCSLTKGLKDQLKESEITIGNLMKAKNAEETFSVLQCELKKEIMNDDTATN